MRAIIILLAGLVTPGLAAADATTDARSALDALIADRAAVVRERDALRVQQSQSQTTLAAQTAQLAAQAVQIADLNARVPVPPKACDFVIAVGVTEVPVEPADLKGKTICLENGEHPFVLQPPSGLGGFTVRARMAGKASVLGVKLHGNAIDVEGIRVPCARCAGGSAIWTRTTASP